jgi:hypothetical protein
MPRYVSDSAVDLSVVRREITELVAKNAVPMVQQAIDAVREEGQYQAIKCLFEMIGLYPADARDESAAQGSLAQILLDYLVLSDVTTQEIAAGEKSQPIVP